MEKFLDSAQNQSDCNSEKSVGKKRKRSVSTLDDDGQPAEKYLELSEVFSLNQFSDEVLIEIFKYVDSNTMLSLQRTCSRFYGLVKDNRLWGRVDTMSAPISSSSLKCMLERAHKGTNIIRINGTPKDAAENKQKRECLLRYVIPKCQHLVDLELEHVYVNFAKIRIQDFPKNLRRLVFRHVSIHWPDDAHTIFKKIDKTLLSLQELVVESCYWFHPYDIMLFSKCPSLKRLSLRGCQNLSDFVPYGSMAARFGFKSLEFLDIRNTPITDSDLQCFNAILTLRELLLECPPYLRIGADKNLAPEPSPSSSASTSAGERPAPSTSRNVFFELVPEGVGRCGTLHIPRGLSNVLMTINLAQNIRPGDRIPGDDHGDPSNRMVAYPDGSPNHFNRILRNPQFWDIIDAQQSIDPLGPCSTMKTPPSPITNRSISCFGRPANPIDQKVIWIRVGNRPTDNTLERLCLRHYKRVTDDSLKHLVQCSPNLVYLDVTGTGVTAKGIKEFKTGKANCEVICENIQN